MFKLSLRNSKRLLAILIVGFSSFTASVSNAVDQSCRVVVSATNGTSWTSSAKKVGSSTTELYLPPELVSQITSYKTSYCKDRIGYDLNALVAKACAQFLRPNENLISNLPGMANLQIFYVNSLGNPAQVASKQVLCQDAMGANAFQRASMCYVVTSSVYGTGREGWIQGNNPNLPECYFPPGDGDGGGSGGF